MRIYLLLLALLIMVSTAWAGGTFTVTEAEYIVVSGNTSDTLGRTMITPDSMRIVVTDSAGTELFDAWFESADAQCALNGDVITFFDQWEDINGAASIGVFSLMVTIASDANNNIDLFSNQNYVIRGVNKTVTETYDEVGDILDTLQNHDNWVAQQSTVDTIKDTLYNTIDVNVASIDANAITATAINADAITEAKIADNAIAVEHIAANAIGASEIADGAIDAATLTEPTYAKVADSVWDEVLTGGTHNVQNSAGKRLRAVASDVISSGTGRGAPSNITFLLASAESAADDFYNGHVLKIISGTGVSQERTIEDYTGATDSIDLHVGDNWTTNPANNDQYEIVGGHAVEVNHIHDNVIDAESINNRALSLAKFDTAMIAAYYDFGIWIDDGAGNANTTVGVDGTRANPVSTLAAARVLADSMGIQKYYLTNNSSLTLAATHEDWEFIGIGEMNQISFGNQDIDNSVFCHLMLTGIQGGTGSINVHDCYLDAADSLKGVIRDSWFSDTISVKVSDNTVFDQCYSAVAGNNTPGLDFNSAAGTVNISIRHYSGGLALFNMTSNHTISYESDGQLVVDASCTSANITARGNMTITDNGTTSSITKDAVFSRSEADLWVWSNIDTTVNVDSALMVEFLIDRAWDEDSTGHWTPPNMAFISGQTAAGFTLDQIWEYDTANISGAQAVGTMLKDTSVYQGAAGSLDSTAVYGAVTQVVEDSGLSYNRKFKDIDIEYAYGITADTFLQLPTDSAATPGGSDSTGGLHCATWYFDDPWGPNAGLDSIADTTPNWKYWMVWSGWNTEYTCIAVSNDKINWVIPYYVDTGGTIVEAPNPINDHVKMSDPFLYYENDTLYLIDREGVGSFLTMYRTSVNGVNWSDTVHIWSENITAVSFVNEDTAYGFYYGGLIRTLMTSWQDTSTILQRDTCSVTMRNGGTITIAHAEVDKIASNKYLILCHEATTRALYLGESDDGITFTINNEPVIVGGVHPNWDNRRLYKSAMQPLVDGSDNIYLDVYYSGFSTGNWHIGKSEIKFKGKHEPLQMADNIIFNGSFEGEYTTDGGEDSYIPDGWILFNEGMAAFDPAIGVYEYESSYRGRVFGMGRYNALGNIPDTAMVYQHVGKLVAGTYMLSVYMENDCDTNCAVGIAIDTDTLLVGFVDSIFLTADTSGYFYITKELSAGHHYVKLWVSGNAPSGCIFDDVRLEKIADDPFGSGAALVTHYVRDTANNVMVSDVKMDINTLAGTDWADVNTGSGGYGTYNANVNDTLVVTCFKPGYVFPVDTVVIASTSHTDTTSGYQVAIGSPGAVNTCRLYGFGYDIEGNGEAGIKMWASLQGTQAIDTCSDIFMGDFTAESSRSDATGRVTLDLIHSTCFSDSMFYNITVNNRANRTIFRGPIYVPAQDSLDISEQFR